MKIRLPSRIDRSWMHPPNYSPRRWKQTDGTTLYLGELEFCCSFHFPVEGDEYGDAWREQVTCYHCNAEECYTHHNGWDNDRIIMLCKLCASTR